MMQTALAVLVQLAVSGPLYLVWLVGILLAAFRRAEAPAAYSLVLIALPLFLLTGILGTVAYTVLPEILEQRASSPAHIGIVLSALGIVRTTIDAAGWALILVALFRRRGVGAPGAVRQA